MKRVQSLYAFPAGATTGTYLQKAAMGGSYTVAAIAEKLNLTPLDETQVALSERKLGQDDADDEVVGEEGGEKVTNKEDVDLEEEEDDGDEGEKTGKEEEKDDGDEDAETEKNSIRETEETILPPADKTEPAKDPISTLKTIISKAKDDERDNEGVGVEPVQDKEEGDTNEEHDETVKDKEEEDDEDGGDETVKDNEEEDDEDEGGDVDKIDDEEDENEMLRDGRAAVAFRAVAARQARGSAGPIVAPRPASSTRSAVVSGAGAVQAATKKRDMDRFMALIEKRKKMMEAKGKSFSLLRTVGAAETKPVGPGGPVVLKNPGTSGDTTVMRANTPGTFEFEQRKKQILEIIAKDKSRRSHSRLFGAKPTTIPDNQQKQPFLNRLRLPFKKDIKPAGIVRKTFESVPVVKRIFKMTPEEELILDVSLSFVTGLKHGVFMSEGPLNNEKKEALQGWLNLLSIGLPPEWGLHMLIDALSNQMQFISTSDANLMSVINKFPLSRSKWSKKCRKNDGSGGFSCGMWKLLHIVTVGVAEHRGGLNLVESGMMNSDTEIFSPDKAGEAIREYMNSFFGCRECREHFVNKYDDCSFRRCERLTANDKSASADDWKQLALWMWEVHNDVSVRVSGKRFDRLNKQLSVSHLQGAQQLKIIRNEEDEIRVIWPSLESCIVCFLDDGRWNEDSVFEFLERTYWDAPNAKFDRLLTHRSLEGEDASGGGFIWIMMIIAVTIVVLVSRHVNNLSFQKQLRTFLVSSAIGAKNKIEVAVAGKHRTA